MRHLTKLPLFVALLSSVVAAALVGPAADRSQSRGSAGGNNDRKNTQPKKNLTELLSAAADGDRTNVLSLIDKGVDPKTQDDDGRSALMLAAANGHTEIVKDLIGLGAEVNVKTKNTLTSYGALTPLIAASLYNGNAEIVKALLAAGADVEARDMHGETALMLASFKGKIDIAKTLVAGGANVNAGATPDQKTALMSAAAAGQADLVRLLLSSGARIDAKTVSGFTALMFAAQGGHLTVVQKLISAGADVNATNENSETVLKLALKGGHSSVVKSLLLARAME